MLHKLKSKNYFQTVILASAMFITIGLGLLELIREVTEPEKAPIRNRLPSSSLLANNFSKTKFITVLPT